MRVVRCTSRGAREASQESLEAAPESVDASEESRGVADPESTDEARLDSLETISDTLEILFESLQTPTVDMRLRVSSSSQAGDASGQTFLKPTYVMFLSSEPLIL